MSAEDICNSDYDSWDCIEFEIKLFSPPKWWIKLKNFIKKFGFKNRDN